jgi:hypothetical protein
LSRALRAPAERDPVEFRVAITGVTRGFRPGELLYTLETDEISGVFTRDAQGIEKRLFHTADFRTSHPDPHPNGAEIAVSVNHAGGLANLAVLKSDGSDLVEVTEGDSVDRAPRWVPGPGRRLVFESAGVARARGGRFHGYGPSAIQQLDLDTGEISCLAQDPAFDLLSPRIAADGALYYLRRPKPQVPVPATPKPSFLWLLGKLIDLNAERITGRALFGVPEPDGKTKRVPASWLLVRKTAETPPETVASNAVAFDLAGDGSLIYSTGWEVYRIPAAGQPATKILAGTNLDLVAAL